MIRAILLSGAVATGMTLAAPARALSTELGDWSLQLNSLFSAGAAMRMQERDERIVGLANGGAAYSTNGDDGNLAYDRGDLVSGGSKFTSDLTASYGDYGFFVRGTALYNAVIDEADLFDAGDYGAGKEFGLSELAARTKSVTDVVGRDAEILDAYVFGSIPLGERSLSFRVGRQVFNWGESTFVQNGINSLLALNANRLRMPGFETNELFRPSGAIWAAVDLFGGMAFEAFYQYEWEPTLIDAAGTFWSTNDFAGIGGTQANLGFGRANENTPAGTASLPGAPGLACLPVAPVSPAQDCAAIGSTVPRGADVEPSDDGQYGVAVHFPIASLNDMDIGLYAANYHSRLPLLSGISRAGPGLTPADTARYFVEYPEDIELYGTSFNSAFGDWVLQGEYSLKRDQPLQVDDVELLLAGLGAPTQLNPVAGATLGNQYLRGYRRFDVSQVDLGLTRVFGPLAALGYDQLLLLAETAVMHVHSLPDARELALDSPATYTPNPGTAAMNPSTAANLPPTPYSDYASATSWGYNLALRMTYNAFLGPVGLEPTLRFVHDVGGSSPTPVANFVEGRKTVAAALGFSYLERWRADLGYTTYFGAGARNLLTDRDFVELNVKYFF